MHPRSLARSWLTTLGLLAWGVALASCDQNAQDPPEPLTLSFAQYDTLGQVAAELGTYTVPVSEPLSLRNALRAEISLASVNLLSYGRIGGDPEKNVAAFLVSFDAMVNGAHERGGLYTPGVRDNPISIEPSGVDDGTRLEGTFYAFFVEGIGAPPDAPIEFVFQGSEEVRKLVVDPDLHTLPARYAFHLAGSDVNPNGSLDPHREIAVHVRQGSQASPPLRPFELPFSVLFGHSGPSLVGGGVVPNSGVTLGLSFAQPFDAFDFFLLFVEE